MASMRDIKRRRESITSTQQITKAMKLVSTVKLQKSRSKAEDSKAYFNGMFDAVASILGRSSTIVHPYLQSGESSKKAVIAITSNRGLAGGYNSNIAKVIGESGLSKEDVLIYAVGRKGRDTLKRRGYEIKADYSDIITEPMYRDAADIGEELLHAFRHGEIGEIYLTYTAFKNTVSQEAKMIKLLPVEFDPPEKKENQTAPAAPMNFEISEDEALDMIIPKYVSSLIYGALLEALASENGARMTAMDAATNNAEDMIEDLELKFNRARQGSITQEITEIIAGAQAIQ